MSTGIFEVDWRLCRAAGLRALVVEDSASADCSDASELEIVFIRIPFPLRQPDRQGRPLHESPLVTSFLMLRMDFPNRNAEVRVVLVEKRRYWFKNQWLTC